MVKRKAPAVAPAAAHVRKTGPAKPAAVHTTTAWVRYYDQPKNGEDPRIYKGELPEGVAMASNLQYRGDVQVTVTDLRSAPQSFNLRDNGFQLLEKLKLPWIINWLDDEQVKKRVYPLVDAFLKKVTGATRTRIFHHKVRSERIGAFGPLVPKEEARCIRKIPLAAVQVWRPLEGPVDESPLGVVDASTVDKGDLMQNTLHFPNRTGYTYAVKHKAKHKFYYAKGMEVDEAYVFVCYDSRADGRARFIPHTGLLDHGTSPDAPPRESVELRSYCFWEDLPPQEAAMQL